jgi:hypothetical protein
MGDLFFKATLLARESGASEIGIDALLAALDVPVADMPTPETPDSECCAFFINSDWMSMSSEVVTALAPFGELEQIDLDGLRNALLLAKKNKADTERDSTGV